VATSRRDFLRMGVLGLEAVAFRKPIKALTRAEMTLEREKGFETKKAIYFPFFESHVNRDSGQGIVDCKPDYLFIEMASQSQYIQQRSSASILLATEVVPTRIKPDVQVGRSIDDQTLGFLVENESMVLLEGVELTPEQHDFGDLAKVIENYGTAAFVLAKVGLRLKKQLLDKKSIGTADVAVEATAYLAQLWFFLDIIADDAVGREFSKKNDNPGVSELRESAERFKALTSLTHPDNLNIFMRDIFMALKLGLIAEENPLNVQTKPKIAFRMGASHGAVSDMVRMGREVTMSMLEVYPAEVLLKLVNHNIPGEQELAEKIDAFCTTVAIPVKDAMSDGVSKQFLFDSHLSDYLKGRLIKE
jgi:hypothetical protein